MFRFADYRTPPPRAPLVQGPGLPLTCFTLEGSVYWALVAHIRVIVIAKLPGRKLVADVNFCISSDRQQVQTAPPLWLISVPK